MPEPTMPNPPQQAAGAAYNVQAHRTIFRYLDSVGDGTGTEQMTGDYSVTPAFFRFNAPSDQVCFITRMIIYIEAVGAFNANKYGSLDELANGVTVAIYDGAETVIKTLTPLPVKSNARWAQEAHEVEARDWGSGSNALSVRWMFTEGGTPLRLEASYSLRIHLADNLSVLDQHTAKIDGYCLPLSLT